MMHRCKITGQEFHIDDNEKYHYSLYGVDLPSICPDQRQRLRISWRNVMHLFKSNSSISGKAILSSLRPDSGLKVITTEEWYSDNWDAKEYAQDYSDALDFFEQWYSLFKQVPHMNLLQNNCENSEYTHMSANSKNCYMLFGCVDNIDCYYGHIVWSSENCLDNLYCKRMRWCYECIDCMDCFELFYSTNCNRCSISSYLYNCTDCSECIACYGLIRGKWCVLNKAYASKEEYEHAKNQFLLLDDNARQKMIDSLKISVPIPHATIINSENCFGNFIYNSKNCYYCFDTVDSEDCRYCFTYAKGKDCYDYSYTGIPNELCYNGTFTSGRALICCLSAWNCFDSAYLYECVNCSDCIACVGLKNAKYCIFNKQYTEEEYNALKSKIIQKLKAKGAWGEFFPMHMSPYPYNDTMAQEYYPMTKEQALEASLKWGESITITGDLPGEVHTCSVTGKPFKILAQEKSFYSRFGLEFPVKCPEQRHNERMKKRNPRMFWQRNSMKSNKEIWTTYSPDRIELLWDRDEYLQEFF